MGERIYNFSAGPATLPLEVLQSAQKDLVNYQGCGMSVMEMSHRSPVYDHIHRSAMDDIRDLLGIPENYSILFLQGGASLQFSMVPMNLMNHGKADYVITGAWSKKAIKEAKKVGEPRVAATTESVNFNRVPDAGEFDFDPGTDYVHLTSNNTIFGTQFREFPDTGDAPLVIDMSSDIMCRPIDVSKTGLIYAGAQKNLGPSGVTLVIIRKDLLDRSSHDLPTMLDYRTHESKDSLFNTPPCWAIYMVGLACRWLLDGGGLAAMETKNEAKADLLYNLFDNSDFYRGTVEKSSRSLMNIPFRLPTEELEKRFIAGAAERGLVNLKGHRSVGGVRASIYNAMPHEGVQALVDFMNEFEKSS